MVYAMKQEKVKLSSGNGEGRKRKGRWGEWGSYTRRWATELAECCCGDLVSQRCDSVVREGD